MEEFKNLQETKLTSQPIFDGDVLHIYKDTVRLPLRELVEKVLNGEIPDAKTQAAALRVWCMLQEGKLS